MTNEIINPNDVVWDAEVINPADVKWDNQPEPSVGFFGKVPLSKYQAGERNIMGNIMERPAAAIRGAILNPQHPIQGYMRGAVNPTNVPTFQDLAIQNFAPKTSSTALNFLGGLPASTLGLGADVLTNPANLLMMLIGKAPLPSALRTSGANTLGELAMQTRPMRALENLINKPVEDLVPKTLMSEKGGVLPNVVKPITQDLGTNISNLRNPTQFAQNVRQSMFGMRQKLGSALDQGISELSQANPEKTIDLSEHFANMKDAMITKDAEGNLINPGLRSDINTIIRKIKNPEEAKAINNLIANPEQASQLTLRQAEDIKRAISQSPIIQRIYKQGKFANTTNGDREILDLLDNIKNTQAEQFPELAQLRQPYAQYMGAYNKVKGKFKEGVLLGKMRKGFGDEETMRNIQQILPQDTFNQITGFRRMGKVVNALKFGAGVGVGEEVLRKMILPILGKAFKD